MQNRSLCEETLGTEGCEEVAFLSRKILDLNKQLIESEKCKSRFLALVASELYNPMTALLGMVSRLALREDDPIYTTVHAEALLLEFRMQNLLAAARIESGNADVSPALVHPKQVIEEALGSLKYALEGKNLIVSIEDTLNQTVVTDPQKLYLIVKNLLSNACTYGKSDGHIGIFIGSEGERFTVEVTNSGEGPNVAFKPQVFTRFAQDTAGKHGLGLGLSVVRHFCEWLGGGVDYRVGEGTVTFSVTLPVAADGSDTIACGSDEFLFETFDGAIEL